MLPGNMRIYPSHSAPPPPHRPHVTREHLHFFRFPPLWATSCTSSSAASPHAHRPHCPCYPGICVDFAPNSSLKPPDAAPAGPITRMLPGNICLSREYLLFGLPPPGSDSPIGCFRYAPICGPGNPTCAVTPDCVLRGRSVITVRSRSLPLPRDSRLRPIAAGARIVEAACFSSRPVSAAQPRTPPPPPAQSESSRAPEHS